MFTSPYDWAKLKSWKKLWWGLFFGLPIGVLILRPESDFSHRIRGLFHTLQDSIRALQVTFVAWLEQSPENWWQIFGPFSLLLLTFGVMFGYLRTNSDRWQELFIKAFVPLLAATLTLYGTFILDVAGWAK